MVGKNLYGSLPHLWRICNNAPKAVLLRHNEFGYIIGHAIGITREQDKSNVIVILNNQGINNNYSSSDINQDVISLIQTYNYKYLYLISKLNENYDVYLLPDDFNEKYKNFLAANKKQLNLLYTKYGNFSRDVYSMLSYIYTEGSKNFYVWAIQHIYNNRIPFESIKFVFWFNENYHQLIKNLSLKTITAYVSRESFFQLLAELQEIRSQKRINDAINLFNTNQKKLLQQARANDEFTAKNKKALSAFTKLSLQKKKNFVQKMSSVNEVKDILNQLNLATAQLYNWNYTDFMEYISQLSNLNLHVVYDSNKVVVLEVDDYETIKYIAKSTNWCISKNKSYWDNYITNRSYHNAKQYMVFDFNSLEDSRNSIIGITSERDKIVAAHDFNNQSLISNGHEPYLMFAELETSYRYFNRASQLNDILESLHLDSKLFTNIGTISQEILIDKTVVFNEIIKYISLNDMDFLVNSDRFVVFITQNKKIANFLGIKPKSYNDKKCMVMINLSTNGDKQILSCYLRGGMPTIRKRGGEVLYEDIFDVIVDYGIPFSKYSAIDTYFLVDMVRQLCAKGRFTILRKFFSDESFWKTLSLLPKEQIIKIVNSFMSFSDNYLTLDTFNLFYQNKKKLSSFVSCEIIASIIDTHISWQHEIIENYEYNISIKKLTEKFKTYPEEMGDIDQQVLFNYDLVKLIVDNELRGTSPKDEIYLTLTNLLRKKLEYYKDVENYIPSLVTV